MIIPRRKFWAFLAAAGVIGSAGSANANSAAYFTARVAETNVPRLLSDDDKAYYRALFGAIDAGDWTTVQAKLAERSDGPLHAAALAEYYTAANSPKVELPDLIALLERAPDLPQAVQLARMAAKRGALSVPAFPEPRSFVGQPGAPKRLRPASSSDGTMPTQVSSAILDRIKNDDPAGARLLLDGVDAALSPYARAEWRQRVAWSFYIENDDASALAMAIQATQATEGPWIAEAWWTAGLASWRLNDPVSAADQFLRAAQGTDSAELKAAGYYWAARANMLARNPAAVSQDLRLAAARRETLYGLLAAEALGMKGQALPSSPDFSDKDWLALRDETNVRAAVALAEIGQDALAGEYIRHQARIGSANEYAPLSRLARDLGLADTQLWFAYNAPRGVSPEQASRYPAPRWQPATGWKVDPGLVYAHALQESNFRNTAVSGAGAVGLLQITPITVRQHAPALGLSTSVNLREPTVNLAFGQQNLQMLRDSSVTGGLLPKVMAAYNAGLTPVSRWSYQVRDNGDPLLWMESLPYWETRGYVGVVLRNYWMYEAQAGDDSTSRTGLAQNMWPRFPGLSGPSAVRLGAKRVASLGD